MSQILLKDIFHLVTMNDNRNRFNGMDVLIDDNKIVKIARNIEAPDARLVECSTKLVLPGFVNSHHHLFQTMTRNVPGAQNEPLFQWLTHLYEIWKYLDEDVVRYSTLLGCGELLKTGCATTTDHHYLYPRSMNGSIPDIQMAAASEIGIRFAPTRGSMSRGKSQGGLPPDVICQNEDDILIQSEEAIQRYHDPSPFAMQQIHLAPCAPFNITLELMEQTATLARKYGVRLHTHLAETLDENEYCQKVYGTRPLALMESLDWLGADVWFAHGIHFTNDELKLLAKTKTGISHCPTSNMRLGSGFARVPDMRKLGVTVGLAVDGSASNDSSDMVGELRNALLLHRVKNGASAITATDVLEMATLGSATLLGRSDIGSIVVGKAADIAIFELDKLEYTGALSDPMAALIFCGINHTAYMTIVNGRIVVENGQLTEFDEREIIDKGNALSMRMLEKAGVR
ncbi:8-oxoguanine deaminase [candidate division KSB1 bacterium]|nr:8-oxoguanine deaminase [candidate division KSB1 bacterium]